MSQDVTKFDKALRVAESIQTDDLTLYNCEEAPFSIHGVIKDDGCFRRMPRAVSETVSEAVNWLNVNTAGGRVRFVTDSSVVAVSAELTHVGKMPHFALTGSVGFDVYADEGEGAYYVGSAIPPFDVEDAFASRLWFKDARRREITVNFPLYSGVKSLYIGLKKEAYVEAPSAFDDARPVVFYGSSITQGGCASRPGNSYQALLARWLGFDYVNLGFSGSALAEDTMIDYIASLPMRVFVMDYDHNAPTYEHLKNTHEKLFKAVRAAHPTLPVVMMTRPVYRYNEEELARLALVTKTYENAKAAGDDHVYLIDGRELVTEEFADIATVDGCHPNDAGFYAMAKRVAQTLKTIL